MIFKNKTVLLVVTATWVLMSILLTVRMQLSGAAGCNAMKKTLEYTAATYHSTPHALDLNKSYKQWALGMIGTDQSNYLRVAMGLTEGHGFEMHMVSPDEPNSKSYMPYYFQAPGTPWVISMLMKIFGGQTIMPYFIFSLLIYLATALIACSLAANYFTSTRALCVVGILNLICLPALDFNYSAGLFASEILAAPFVGLALLSLSKFWRNGKIYANANWKLTALLTGIAFGAFIAIASYMRDVYSSFAYFCFLLVLAAGMMQYGRFKPAVVFVAVASVTLAAVQQPWKRHNMVYFNESTMSACTYYGRSLWYENWTDNNEPQKWSAHGGLGLGNYLAPERSDEILSMLHTDIKSGSALAVTELVRAVAKHPMRALVFKLKDYDALWMGLRENLLIYAFCLVSCAATALALLLTRVRFDAALWSFPMFILAISPLIHYEDRYVQPFFLFITPIAVTYLLIYVKVKIIDAAKRKHLSDKQLVQAWTQERSLTL